MAGRFRKRLGPCSSGFREFIKIVYPTRSLKEQLFREGLQIILFLMLSFLAIRLKLSLERQ